MKILILRFSSLGDILLATPVIDEILKHYPHATIDWVVKEKFKATLASHPKINKLYTFNNLKECLALKREISANHYDLVFDLHKNKYSYLLSLPFKQVFRYKKRELSRLLLVYFKKRQSTIPVTQLYFEALIKAGLTPSKDWKLSFFINPQSEKELIEQYQLNKDYVAIAPGASYESKMWPKEYFRELCTRLKLPVILLGHGKREEESARFIKGENSNCLNLVSQLNLEQSAIILKNARYVISNDSGLLHLAEAFQKPLIAIFGSTSEELGFFPHGANCHILEDRTLPCRPCTHFGRHRCPLKHFKCMRNLTVERILKLIEQEKL